MTHIMASRFGSGGGTGVALSSPSAAEGAPADEVVTRCRGIQRNGSGGSPGPGTWASSRSPAQAASTIASKDTVTASLWFMLRLGSAFLPVAGLFAAPTSICATLLKVRMFAGARWRRSQRGAKRLQR